MQNEISHTKRTAEGTIDVRHYALIAAAERRETRGTTVRMIGRGSKRALLAIACLFMFWNIPPMGSAGSKEMPYR